MSETLNFGDMFKQAKKEMELIPDGEYQVFISQAEATKASTGSPMIKVRLKIDGGPQDGRVLFTQFVVTVENPSALTIFFRNMAAFGLTDTFWDNNPQLFFIADALINRKAIAVVNTRKWQGVDRNNVEAIKPIPGLVQQAPVVPAGPVAPGASPASSPVSAGPVAPPSGGPKAPSF